MNTTLSRKTTPPAPGGVRRALRALSAMAFAAVDRLTLPMRDVPPESFRFPPF